MPAVSTTMGDRGFLFLNSLTMISYPGSASIRSAENGRLSKVGSASAEDENEAASHGGDERAAVNVFSSFRSSSKPRILMGFQTTTASTAMILRTLWKFGSKENEKLFNVGCRNFGLTAC